MRIAKLFAYLALAIFLPLWLYNLSKNDLKETSSTPQETKTEIIFNSGFLDSIIALIPKSNPPIKPPISVRPPDNPEIESSLHDLIKISTENAKSMQILLSKERNINVSVSPIEITQQKKDSSVIYKNQLPTYNFSEKGPFPIWEIRLKDFNMWRDSFCLVLFNTSMTDTAYLSDDLIEKNNATPSEDEIIFNSKDKIGRYDSIHSLEYTSHKIDEKLIQASFEKRNSNLIFPQNQVRICYYNSKNQNINGVFRRKNKRGKLIEKKFEIQVYVE